MTKPTPEQVAKAERIATAHSLTLCLAAIGKQEGDISLAKQLLADDVAKALAAAFDAGRRSTLAARKQGEAGNG